MFGDFNESNEDQSKKPSESMAGIREKQKKMLNEDIKKARRDMLQNMRFETFQNGKETLSNTSEFSLSHLANIPNSEILKTKINEWSKLEPQNELLYTFLASIESQDIYQQHYGMIGLRRILSQKRDLPIQQVMDHPSFFKILKMCKDESQPHLQLESTWCLANMASGTSEQTSSLIQKNIIEVFVNMCQSKFSQIAEQAIWGLGNISGDCLEFRNKILKSETVEVLLQVFNQSREDKIKNLITWVFSNICRLRPTSERISPIMRHMLSCLVNVFTNTKDQDLKNDCLFGIYSNAKEESVDIFENDQFLESLLRFYSECQQSFHSQNAQLSAIHTLIGGFTSGDNKYTKTIIRIGFLPYLKNSLHIPNPTTAREVCWIFSNLAIGEVDQVRLIIAEPLLLETIEKFTKHSDVNLAREAVWMICNLSLTKNEENIGLLIERGVLLIFKNTLESQTDNRMITLILEAFLNLLIFFKERTPEGTINALVIMMINNGIGTVLENLQFNKSDIIYLKTLMILEEYFPLAN